MDYSAENMDTDDTSEEDIQRLLERTRQRREMLNQKLGKTPEPMPRKRVLEDSTTENVVIKSKDEESPGKRQCLREEAMQMKADTPAILGVKSRMQQIVKTRDEQGETSILPATGSHESPVKENNGTRSRRGRLAKLAANINNWEDDLSHPSIQKKEEKKPKWQPPRIDSGSDSTGSPARSPVKAHNPSKSAAPPPPPPPPVISSPAVSSPKRTTATSASPAKHVSQHSVKLNSPAKNSQTKHKIRQLVDQVPVNAKDQTDLQEWDEDPTEKPIRERLNSWKNADTPKKKAVDPSEKPMSSKLATWEKVSSTPTKTAVAKKVHQPARQMATPVSDKPPLPRPVSVSKQTTESSEQGGDPASRPVSSRMASWQQRVDDETPQKEEEPTAYSVGARMSAWEDMSSSNQVAHIKKVDPGACSPTKSPMRTPAPVNKTPAAKNKNLTPRKSFKDSIVEKAGQLKNSPVKSTPVKSTSVKLQPGASPGKVGSATKMMQQRLLEQAQHSKTDDIADKLRRDRMNELASLQNRWQNGMLKEDVQPTSQTDQNKPVAYETKLSESEEEPSKVEDRREAIKAQARAEDTASYTFTNKDQPKSESQPPARPPAPKTGSQQGQSSIYRLISQKRGGNEKPNVTRSESTKRVQFEEGDSFDSTDGEDLVPQRHQHPPIMSTEEETDDMDYTDTQSEGTTTQDEEEYAAQKNEQVFIDDESDSDDVSLSAFVPASVRRQSVLPHRPDEKERQRQGQQQKVREPVAPVPASVRHQSTTNLRRLVQEESSSSLDSESSASSSQSSLGQPPRRHDYTNDSDEGDEQGVSDLLDEAIGAEDDTDDEVVYRHRQPVAAPRHHRHESYAIANDSQPVYSVTSYRNSQNIDWSSEGKKKIVRNRTYSADVVEEDIQMPTSLPRDIESKSIKERIQELHELVSQEQSVIMQTSNALNQCCAANSHFAGSAEQVECHRLLLLSCQKRLAYLTEVQRLKDSGQLDPPGTGPKGSLTISDIRLPLKKDFVTRIGSVQGSYEDINENCSGITDNTVHYFLILIRNHTQVIVTQMLSTHDPMMRGSLDFPNLIKIHGISGSFKLCMEIYSMSVSKEYSAKDKKRKTPKKALKSTSITGPSPGGPTAVRTTSFTLITTIPITMRHLDKSSFTLERIPYLSPLHGTIYMRLKCLMEQNVEERGFLTMFEDVSGLGAWHRRWCVLTGNKLCWWKYPNDETRKEPIGMMDLKRCITEKIGLIPRDVCARPNTFELATVRQPRRGEPDTLVTKTYNTMTTTRHRLSADTKEERIMWCNKVNRALANIRTWHSDAMRPIKASRKN
ncbi:anillin-like isoform X3 [Mizuhopecten yessoensis]|uniref:Actin-binding protein anillin n=1 Tax=Mizuhopecten yessoensis TaxID=6573 RepID=A0A210QTQ3_MIZYE|nr:anillin-like isoform X3 [Mizuhopecten yessoensis]OWF52128.1 Actin-binding protein anillin [Mizuhopecten yessoensis]